MKARLYLETTIVSYLVARPSRDIVLAGHQQVTRDWWEQRMNDFEIYVSDLVIDEASAGEVKMADKRLALLRPFPLLPITDAVITLAESLVKGGPLPVKAARDATHIALSAVHGVHFLMTWNCKHIANAEMHERIVEICRQHDLNCPVICTPDELFGN